MSNSLAEIRKLKIVYVIARFHPFRGGAEVNCLKLATRAAAAGHQVTVITTDISPYKSPLPAQETYQGINIIRVHAWNSQLNAGFYPGMLPRLLHTPADIVHVENGPGFIWRDLCLFVKKLVSPHTIFISTPHGGFITTPQTHTGVKRILAHLLKLVATPYVWLSSQLIFHHIIAVNSKQHTWIKSQLGFGGEKVSIIHNGIDSEMILSESQLETKISHLTSLDQIPVTCVGRMSQYKGFHYVIQAMATPELAGKIRLTIAGRPEAYYPELVKLVSDLGLQEYVYFALDPSDEELLNLITNDSYISILPSQFEATGIVLLEAMARGNAIITTENNEAAHELITPNQNGEIVPWADVPALKSALKSIINSPDLLGQMITENHSRVANFTWDKSFDNYAQLLNHLTTSN